MNVRELINVIKFKTDNASLKAAETAVNRLKRNMDRIKPMDLKYNTDTTAIDSTIKKLQELDRQQQKVIHNAAKAKVQGAMGGRTGNPTGTPGGASMLGGLKGAFVALGGYALINEIKQTADAMMSLSSRIRLVTKDDAERLQVESKLYQMAMKNRASLEDLGDLYYKTASSAKQFGASQEDVLKLTDIVSKSLIVGGAPQ